MAGEVERRSLPLGENQIRDAGTALRKELDARKFQGNRQFWLGALNLTADELTDLGQLTEMELTELDLPKSNPALFNKLKALVELVKHYPS